MHTVGGLVRNRACPCNESPTLFHLFYGPSIHHSLLHLYITSSLSLAYIFLNNQFRIYIHMALLCAHSWAGLVAGETV